MTPREFESFARSALELHYGCALPERNHPSIPKRFDYVSSDCQIVGDAKYYTLVNRSQLPPAKLSIISEHVWLLEQCDAKFRFLAFGNQIEVPKLWLSKYGGLIKRVAFLFVDTEGKLSELRP